MLLFCVYDSFTFVWMLRDTDPSTAVRSNQSSCAFNTRVHQHCTLSGTLLNALTSHHVCFVNHLTQNQIWTDFIRAVSLWLKICYQWGLIEPYGLLMLIFVCFADSVSQHKERVSHVTTSASDWVLIVQYHSMTIKSRLFHMHIMKCGSFLANFVFCVMKWCMCGLKAKGFQISNNKCVSHTVLNCILFMYCTWQKSCGRS